MSRKQSKQLTTPTQRRELLRAEKLPYLNFNQVRRAKLPFHEALLAELNEADFHSSVELFNSLIDSTDDDLQGRKKELARDRELLEDIFNSLVEMENASSTPQRLQLLLELSNRLASSTHTLQTKQPCPAWVVDKVFQHALKATRQSSPQPLQPGVENTSVQISILFSYGKWLSEQPARLDEAICHLNCAMKASKEAGVKIDLRNQITGALCEALRLQSINITVKSPLQALKLAQRALNLALETPRAIPTKLNVEIKLQISRCCILLREFGSAQIILEQSFGLTESAKLHELGFAILKLQIELGDGGGCDATIGSEENELKLLRRAQQHAKEKCSSNPAAEAEILILHGKFCTRKQIYGEALESFGKAVKIYEHTDEMKRVGEVSFMMALPKVEQNFKFLVRTIRQCDEMRMGRNEALEALIRYIDQKTSLAKEKSQLRKDETTLLADVEERSKTT